MSENRVKSSGWFNSHRSKNHTDENNTEPEKMRLIEVEKTKCDAESAAYELSREGSRSIALRTEGREGGEKMRQGTCKSLPFSFSSSLSSYIGAQRCDVPVGYKVQVRGGLKSRLP